MRLIQHELPVRQGSGHKDAHDPVGKGINKWQPHNTYTISDGRIHEHINVRVTRRARYVQHVYQHAPIPSEN